MNSAIAERAGDAAQWRLVWRRFRKHRLAMGGAAVVVAVYVVAVLAEFLAPTTSGAQDEQYAYAPPQRLHVYDEQHGFGLHVHGYTSRQDPETFERTFTVDSGSRIPVGFFVRGESYKLWGVIPWDRHLIGPVERDAPFYLWGADRAGRDVLSRIIHGSRVSLSIGLVGVAVSFVLGLLFGGVSGFYGGMPDSLIQRVIEFLIAVPTLPLWLSLSAAVPSDWGPLMRYFAITVILSVIGWTGLARVVRGRFLSLREEDFVVAARLDGCRKGRIIFRHMVPSFASHMIASLTLAVPGMILGETALSFLGLGLQSPAVSWGVLLQDAQNVRAIETAPWLMMPGAAIFVTVLAMNFVGDGLRDAADPYR
ncbi:ABC transporter permease [Actinopolymorpha sp. B11F2]|uniref:ABC transporter permease n=1 Tax=Actinopolymorpha sp. B11F2 TaxID=3160862 RepID=UPI0032E51475